MLKFFFHIYGMKIFQVEYLKEIKISFEQIFMSQGGIFCVL